MSGPVKHDAGKLRFDLFPVAAHVAAVRGLTYGASKYSDRNYAEGNALKWGRLVAALLRHMVAWRGGEEVDPESGLHHLDHVGSCWAMLIDLVSRGLGEDDRAKIEGFTLGQPGEAPTPSQPPSVPFAPSEGQCTAWTPDTAGKAAYCQLQSGHCGLHRSGELTWVGGA